MVGQALGEAIWPTPPRPFIRCTRFRPPVRNRVLTSILISISIERNQPLPCDESYSMYVCLCEGVTDGQIRDAIFEGCCSYRDVRTTLGVASQCGKCACLAKQVVRETLSEVQSSQTGLAYPASFVTA